MLKPPNKALEDQITNVDNRFAAIKGNHPAAYIQVEMAAAQVNATCALVHAIRELTEEVRKLREAR